MIVCVQMYFLHLKVVLIQVGFVSLSNGMES